MSPSVPRPLPTHDDVEFWEATRRGEFRLQRCSDCSRWRHYPRPACPDCYSREYSWDEVSGRGRIYTWTVVRGPTLPVFQERVPLVVADVLLDEGVHFQAELLDCTPEEVRADLPVEATLTELDDEFTLVKFRPANR
ncbi:OB-fold domain-containing protein [Myxococcota bacterium]|nr:OB-fold domain-containing protein [Myxococcota bacterium]